jgi:16S rRNA (cytosine967-C5)-methyltransferase
LKQSIAPARIYACKILHDVMQNGAYSNIAVNKHLASLKNDADRRLAVQISYGTIKKKNRLEKVLFSFSTRKEIEPTAHIILLMSLYQIMYLDKIPQYAIVNDAVNLCRFYGLHAAASFVNGVLRNVLRNKETLTERESDSFVFLYYEYGFPQWISELIFDAYGDAFLQAYAKQSQDAPDLFLRVNTRKTDTEALQKQFSARGIETEPTYVPDTLKTVGSGDVFGTEPFRNGLFYVQDLSGVIAGYALSPQHEDRMIDLCSAPGGKSFNLGILSQDGSVLSCDISTAKLELVKRTAKQLGLEHLKAVRRDATKIIPEERGTYDCIVCDVPCSGLGVVRRKPEILSRLKQEDISALVALQEKILDTAIAYLKQGGTLVYSTCTLNPSENEVQIEKALQRHPEIKSVPIVLSFELQEKHLEMKDGRLLLTPMRDGCDGFFMAKLTKKTDGGTAL